MTEFSLPLMIVNYDGRWIDVDIHGDIADWPSGARATCLTASASGLAANERRNSPNTWIFPQYGAAMVMATGFANLQEAGMWRPVLDELASAIGLKGES
jgi:hypothetical protein